MAKPIKKERNRLVVQLREKGWSFQKIADELKLKARSTVHEIYTNELKRSGKCGIK